MGERPQTDSKGIILSIALVWFSTHVGGGFASGASQLTYFIDYGIWCVVLPPLSLAGIAFVYWWGWRYARIAETYDYRTFNDSFYGKYAPIFSNLYGILIVFVVVIGCGVAFATGSSMIAELTGIPYLLTSALVGAAIFFVCIFGTNAVRRASVFLSAAMIIALTFIYVPAIVAHADQVGEALSVMQSNASPAGFIAAPDAARHRLHRSLHAFELRDRANRPAPARPARLQPSRLYGDSRGDDPLYHQLHLGKSEIQTENPVIRKIKEPKRKLTECASNNRPLSADTTREERASSKGFEVPRMTSS